MSRKTRISLKCLLWFLWLFSIPVLLIPDPIQAGSKKDVIVYGVSYHPHVGTAFTQKTGIRVRYIRMRGGGSTLSRVTAEREHPVADLWFGGSLPEHAAASYDGLTTPYRPSNFDDLDPRLRDPLGGNRVNSLYVGILGFVVRPH
ncbi:MAG: hypothetical protein GY757_58350 [bacterium]|nr:hypothetical protein [bacterium]